jgi:hypothetical protein
MSNQLDLRSAIIKIKIDHLFSNRKYVSNLLILILLLVDKFNEQYRIKNVNLCGGVLKSVQRNR